MRIGNQVINLDVFSKEDLDILIKEARKIRERIATAQRFAVEFNGILSDAEQNHLRLCNKYTGEIFKADEWLVYDEEAMCPRVGEWHT